MLPGRPAPPGRPLAHGTQRQGLTVGRVSPPIACCSTWLGDWSASSAGATYMGVGCWVDRRASPGSVGGGATAPAAGWPVGAATAMPGRLHSLFDQAGRPDRPRHRAGHPGQPEGVVDGPEGLLKLSREQRCCPPPPGPGRPRRRPRPAASGVSAGARRAAAGPPRCVAPLCNPQRQATGNPARRAPSRADGLA